MVGVSGVLVGVSGVAVGEAVRVDVAVGVGERVGLGVMVGGFGLRLVIRGLTHNP